MKKVLSILLVVMMIFAMAACGGDPAPAGGGDVEGNNALGLGIVLGLNGTAASEDADGLAQQDATAATVLLDAEGKILECKIDVAQNKINFSATGEVLNKDGAFPTKKEKKEAYGMQPASSLAEGEWYQQIAAFEAYVVGMTKNDVAAIQTVESNGHQVAVDEALLAGCTMQITDFMEAIVIACENTVDAGAATSVYLGIVSDAASSSDASEDSDGVAFSTSTYGCYAADANGVITAALIDCTQAKVSIGADGSVVNVPAEVITKKNLKEAYGMQPASGLAEGEWYQQIAAFEAYVAGMTVNEVAAIETTESNGHTIAVDEALLAGCTMSIADFIEALVVAK